MTNLLEAVAKARGLILGLAIRLQWLPPLLARFCIGWIFTLSGWGKLRNLPEVVSFFAHLGIPAPGFQAPLAATAECVCGLLILLGLLTRLASVPLIVVMVVAIATARKDDVARIPDLFGIVEYLYILLLLYLGAFGPGPLSLDRLIAPRLERTKV